MGEALLESFDAAPARSLSDLAYEKGFLHGQEEALARHADEQSKLSQELVQAVKDLEFGFAEARGEIIQGLRPLFQSICERILPEVAAHSLSIQIAEVLYSAASATSPTEMTIAVSPEQFEVVREGVASVSDAITVATDSGLSTHAVSIEHSKKSVVFDYDALAQSIAEILSNFDQIQENRVSYE